MKRGQVFLLLFFLAIPCRAQQLVLPSWNADMQKVWWTQYPTPDKWPQAADQLKGMLADVYKKDGASAFSNSDFQGWLEHLEWIRLGLECPDVLANANNLTTFIALGKDAELSHLFIEKLDPRDVKKQALTNLIRLAQANLDDLNEYAALGVAYCLVFDQPFPTGWPHGQVKQEAVPLGDLDIVQRFNFYVQADRDKKLDEDLTTLTFEQLKYLVDSEVKLSELAYAQTNSSTISYSRFDMAFFSINYDESRAQAGNYSFIWGYPTYNLADIAKYGGICIDQAYYATILGKGRGIPTLMFRGEGTDGGHAWFGYLSRSGKWELDCGRYETQNYPKGYALDPQTWEPIDDTELANLFKTGEKDPNYQPAENAIAWAMLQGRDPIGRQILDDARSIMPELAITWKLEASALDFFNVSNEDKKTFFQNWITQFSSFADMKVEGQRRLLAVLRKTNDPDADSLQQSIVLQNRSSGFDQGIDAALNSIQDKTKANDWDGARLEYEKTIRDFGEQGGGTLFYGVIQPYIESCLKNGHGDQATHGIKFAEDRMTINPDGVVGEEFAKLKAEVQAQNPAASP